MISIARSAKDSLGRAGESGLTTGSSLFERMRAKMGAKARNYQKLADGAVERATSRKRRSIGTSNEVIRDSNESIPVDESAVQRISQMGVAPVIARYALLKCRGNADEACDWLFDERNREEIERAEVAEAEKIFQWINYNFPQQSLDKFPRADDFDRKLRRESVLSDDGRDASSVGSIPSPRNVPRPGRLSRGSWGSGRLSVDSADDRRESSASRDSAAKDEEADYQALLSDDASGSDCEVETDSNDGTDEEGEAPMPSPPESACWDWPLSRHEKKARVQMLERQMHALDRKSLIQELGELRGQGGDLKARHSRQRSRRST